MPDPIQALLALGAVPTDSLAPTSRYVDTPMTVHRPPGGGAPVPCFGRRWCPPPERLALLFRHPVVEGDRIDLVAATDLGDAALWWRIADAEGAIDPATLTATPGSTLRVTLPDGIAAAPDA